MTDFKLDIDLKNLVLFLGILVLVLSTMKGIYVNIITDTPASPVASDPVNNTNNVTTATTLSDNGDVSKSSDYNLDYWNNRLANQ